MPGLLKSLCKWEHRICVSRVNSFSMHPVEHMKNNHTTQLIRCYAAVIVFVLVLGCSTETMIDANDKNSVKPIRSAIASSTRGIRWSMKLDLDCLSHIDIALSSPFDGAFEVERVRPPAVAGASEHVEKAVMKNCRTYLELRPQGYETVSDREFRVMKYTGARCVALCELKKANPAQHDYLSGFLLDANALSYLSPRLGLTVSDFDVERRTEAERQGMSWKDFEPDIVAVVIGPDEIEVTGDGWTVQLTGYAWGDFDGDGFQDVLLRADAWLSEGTWTSVRLFRLTRTSAVGKLSIAWEYDL